MSKFTFYFKSLLVACGLLLGSANAWADLIPFSESYSSTSTTEGWSTKTGGRYDPTILTESDNYFLSVAQNTRNNNGSTVTGNILVGRAAAGDDFTLIFDMRLKSHTDATKSSSVLSIKDAAGSQNILSLTDGGANSTSWSINGTSTSVTLPGSNESEIGNITWCTYKISRSGVYTYLTITNKSTGLDILARTSIGGASSTGGLGNIVFETSRYNANFAIDNIVLRAIEDGDVPAGTPTSYTIQYQNEKGEEIKSDVVINGLVDDEVTASAAQMASFISGSKKYIYKSGNDNITLVESAASNVITLVFREAAKYNYTITSSYNEKPLPWSVSGWCWEDENTFNVRYPRYQAIETKLVGRAPVSNNLYTSVTVTGDGYSQDLEYTKAADNLLYWSEAENMGAGLTTNATSFTDRVSNSLIVYGASGKIATLLPGKYQVALGVIGHANSGDAATVTYKIKAGDADKKTFTCTGNTLTLGVTDEFTLTETTNITFTCDHPATSRGVDFVYITGTVDDLASNTSVTSLIKNPDVEEDESNGAWQQTVKGWYNTDNVVNYRPLAFTPAQNPNGAFTGTYAYENWTSAAGGLTGQMSQTIGGLPNGAYKLQLAALVRTVNGQFVYGKSNGKTYKTTLSGANETANDYEVIVVVEDNQLEIGLDMNNSGADWAAIDNARLIYAPSVPVTISAAGYATFNSDYALDLDNISGATAYIVKADAASGDNIVITPQTGKVAANTGLILKGAAGTVTIPVAASGTDISATNKLVAVTEDATAVAAGNYVLGANAYYSNVGLYRLSSATTLNKGQAYLPGGFSSVKVLNFIIEGETPTGVEAPAVAEAEEDGVLYNTAGQQVTADYKGIVIKNGKKYLNK